MLVIYHCITMLIGSIHFHVVVFDYLLDIHFLVYATLDWSAIMKVVYDLFIWKSGKLLYMNISIENFNIGRTCVK